MDYKRRLEYWKAANGRWYFHVRSANRTVYSECKPEGFIRLRDCLKALDTFKQPLEPEFVAREITQSTDPKSIYFRSPL